MSSRRWRLAAGVVALSTLFALGLAEAWTRTWTPQRLQRVFSGKQYHLEEIDGVPVWRSKAHIGGSRTNLNCFRNRPDAPRVAILGSSIFYGVRLEQEDTLGALLTERLAPVLGEPPCISNLSEPATAFQNQWARAKVDFELIQPDLVIVEIWENSPGIFKMLGETAWNFGRLEVDAAGYPNPFDLDVELNQWWLSHVGLYRFIALNSVAQARMDSSKVWSTFTETQMEVLMNWSEQTGTDLLLVFCPNLGRPFQLTVDRTASSYGQLETLAESRGIAQVNLVKEFVGMDPSTLGIDTCCHFNALGMGEAASRIAPVAAALLQARQDSVSER